MTEDVRFEQRGPLGVVILDRQRALNALNRATIAGLHAAVSAVAADPHARVLLLTGAGDRAFVAGADIKEMQAYSAIEAQAFARRTMAVFRAIETLPVPAIAVVNGYALGGGNELAMSCDFILASERAVFGQPEVSLGVTAGFGGTQRLTRLVGRARALELLLSGRHVDAAEALRMREEGARELSTEDEDTIIAAMADRPELLQRPILVNGDRAVLARPVERALEIL